MMSLVSAPLHRSNYGLTYNIVEFIEAGDRSDTHSYMSVAGPGGGVWCGGVKQEVAYHGGSL